MAKEMEGKNQPILRLVFSRNESSGYKSGRSSEGGTPDAAEKANTRSAGTFRWRRQRCNAWYRTPNLSAADISPPALSIALSTTLMDSNIQRIVAIGQQPIRVISRDNIQPMVVNDKAEQRNQFSERLRRLLVEHHSAPEGRGLIQWFYDDMKRRNKGAEVVSYESCRKWLTGKDVPAEVNLGIVCTTYGFNSNYLRTGVGSEMSSSDEGFNDSPIAQITRDWHLLTDEGQIMLQDAHRLALKLYKKPQTEKHKRSNGRRISSAG